MITHVLRAGNTPTYTEYLDVTSLTDAIFLIGLLDTGVTIFNQQVRALNLIWALDRAGKLRPASSIAVVGGGIAGLTAAMALRKIFSLNADSSPRTVTLFEKRSVLCPLQRGCATRWVHPHIYDWPEPISTNPSAGLPIMDWRAGRASDVAARIVTQWEDEPSHAAVELEEWRNLRHLKIDHMNREVEWIGERFVDATFSEVSGDKRPFDIIILAIGVGDELGSSKHRAISYWRNETYGQPDLAGRQRRYLVSGTGDGGLIDLLRLRIADFREDRIGFQLAPEGSPSYKVIQQLRAECYRDPLTQGEELFERARKLGQELHLVDPIRRRLRADTLVSLQIREGKRVSDAFRRKSSFVNRFLVSLLWDSLGFSPEFRDLENIGTDEFDEVIVRHGTSAENHVKRVFSGDISDLLTGIKERRHQNSFINEPAELWHTGWPLDHKAGFGPGRPSKRYYVPEATVAVSSAFVSALAPVFSARGGDYRATLHRIITMKAVTAEEHLQQIAHYYGPRAKPESDGKVVGRLFAIQYAVIGLAARTGQVLITRPTERSDDECRALLRVDMQRLGGDSWDPEKMGDEVASVFACPLIYMSEDGGDADKAGRVVAVLFADSTNAAAFNDETVTQITAACEEFGRYLKRIAQSEPGALLNAESQATSHSIDSSARQQLKDFSLLTAASTPPPRIPVEYINLDWWS